MRTRIALLIVASGVFFAGAVARGGVPTIRLGRGPCCIAVVDGTLWVGEHRSGRIAQLDPRSGKVLWATSVPGQAIDYGSLVAGNHAVWVYGAFGVMRIDAKSHAVEHVTGIRSATGLVALGGKMWASTLVGPFVYRIDPAAARVEQRLRVRGRASYNLGAAADGSLWCAGVNAGQTTTGDPNSISVRIDPKTGRITRTLQPFGSGPYGAVAGVRTIAAIGDAIWETQQDDSAGPGVSSTLVRIDARTGKVTFRSRPKVNGNGDAFPDVMTAGDGTLWLQTGPRAIERIDPQTGKVLRTIAIPLAGKRPPTDYWNGAITTGFGSYWITSWPGQGGPSDPSNGDLFRVAR